MILTNTGESGDLCADIYVFNPVGQMIACCACPVKRNGALELSVNNNLTKNPVTGVVPTKGVIMALPSSDCYPSHPNLAAGMKTYTITRSNTSSIVPTHEACVSDQLLTLMRQCANIQRNGGGLGICSCPAQ
jgi:hypothetical protein